MKKRETSLIALGISCFCLGTATPIFAQTLSDNTGTNIWNSVPVMLDSGEALDPELVTRVEELNETSAIAYRDCTIAIEAIEAQYQNQPQRFTREDITPEPPAACVTLERTRQEMEILRVELARLQAEIDENSSYTW